MIHIRISPEDRSELRVDDPCNLRVWMRFTKQCNCGQRVNDVTERTGLDDQDGFRVQSGCPNYCAFGDSYAIVFREADPPLAKVERSPRRLLNALPKQIRIWRADPIFQSQAARPGAAADLLQQSSFARPPDHILRETVGPGYSPYRKCSTLRASFHHAVAPHCPC